MFHIYIILFLATSAWRQADGFCNDVLEKLYSPNSNQEVIDKLTKAQNECHDLFRMMNFDVTFGMRIRCTNKCKVAINDLYSSASEILNCQCGSVKECRVIQRRVKKCVSGKIKSMKHLNMLKGGCTNVYQKCHLDVACRKAFDDMARTCNSMLNGIACTKECEDALKILLSNIKGRKFMSCKCDGSQHYEGECLEIKDRIVRRCSSKSFRNFLDHTKLQVIQVNKGN